ncbi:MAG: antitoxin ParD1/3/4 [Limisphaerales bacterium]|jgi:antitoxin ParD1/3/4
MELSLTPELDEFVREQVRQRGLASGPEYVSQLISAQRERETHDWDWLHKQLRPGIEADESQFHSETADDVIRRGKARLSAHG